MTTQMNNVGRPTRLVSGTGAFHGVMRAATPTASRITVVW
jgi:hypothetical protein